MPCSESSTTVCVLMIELGSPSWSVAAWHGAPHVHCLPFIKFMWA